MSSLCVFKMLLVKQEYWILTELVELAAGKVSDTQTKLYEKTHDNIVLTPILEILWNLPEF